MKGALCNAIYNPNVYPMMEFLNVYVNSSDSNNNNTTDKLSHIEAMFSCHRLPEYSVGEYASLIDSRLFNRHRQVFKDWDSTSFWVTACILIKRVVDAKAKIRLTKNSMFRLVGVAIMMAYKHLEDSFVLKLSAFAHCILVEQNELQQLEIAFLYSADWLTFISETEFASVECAVMSSISEFRKGGIVVFELPPPSPSPSPPALLLRHHHHKRKYIEYVGGGGDDDIVVVV